MAESLVSFLIQKLVLLVQGEAKLLKGVRQEVESITNELEHMQAFLKDADERGEDEQGVKVWVRQVRDVAYDIEDVIDEFMLRMTQRHHRGGVIDCLLGKSIEKLKSKHRIGSEIQDIKCRVREVKERMVIYHFKTSDQGSSSRVWNDTGHDPRVTSLFIEDSEIIGIDNHKEELIGWLVEGDLRRKVVSVVGMGGLGKTTLVKKIYESQRVKSQFKCGVWITVSQSYKINELLRQMISEFYKARKEAAPQGLEAMEEAQLIETLRSYLQEERYIVVLDDVWRIDLGECMKYALPDYNQGSRIMITTRILDVASSIESFGHIYHLPCLPPKDAWTLFCKKAFPSPSTGLPTCPPGLEKVSRKIVGRCQGLPLAIVAIGGLLSKKNNDFKEWKKLNDNLGSELERNPNLTNLTRILSLSYNDLPYYLKACFLYLTIFPEDYLISCKKLIRSWIAEGFVQGKRGKTLEEVGEDNLDELIRRSLIQVGETSADGKITHCRVHDLMRDIILSKSEEENFVMVHTIEQQCTNSCGKIRRLSVHDGGEHFPLEISVFHLRSFFLFGINKQPTSFQWALFSSSRLLKVLDLDGASLESFPKELVNLFHLRYLCLRNTKIKILPKSIEKLQNLETLDLKHTLVSTLPVQILKLRQLRYLVVYGYQRRGGFLSYVSGVKIPKGIGSLKALKKLANVEATEVTELGKLEQLRSFGITNLRREDGIHLCASIEKMSKLCSLTVHSTNLTDLIDLESLSSPPPFLQRLYIAGRLEQLPHWISILQNLFSISLFNTKLVVDPLDTLHALPNLVLLSLHNAYDGQSLSFMTGGFQTLKTLKFAKLERLALVSVEEGALPKLKDLYLMECRVLEKVPPGIEHLTTLKELGMWEMPEEFVMRLRKNGEERWRVQHIPFIHHAMHPKWDTEYLS